MGCCLAKEDILEKPRGNEAACAVLRSEDGKVAARGFYLRNKAQLVFSQRTGISFWRQLRRNAVRLFRPRLLFDRHEASRDVCRRGCHANSKLSGVHTSQQSLVRLIVASAA